MFVEQSIFLPETVFFSLAQSINFHGHEILCNLLTCPPTPMFCIVKISLSQGGWKCKEERYGYEG
jgi:hypothetical protein